jgi:hypothetical protein
VSRYLTRLSGLTRLVRLFYRNAIGSGFGGKWFPNLSNTALLALGLPGFHFRAIAIRQNAAPEFSAGCREWVPFTGPTVEHREPNWKGSCPRYPPDA